MTAAKATGTETRRASPGDADGQLWSSEHGESGNDEIN